jgi:hypothetical protein
VVTAVHPEGKTVREREVAALVGNRRGLGFAGAAPERVIRRGRRCREGRATEVKLSVSYGERWRGTERRTRATASPCRSGTGPKWACARGRKRAPGGLDRGWAEEKKRGGCGLFGPDGKVVACCLLLSKKKKTKQALLLVQKHLNFGKE